jgi:hypothetical protein
MHTMGFAERGERSEAIFTERSHRPTGGLLRRASKKQDVLGKALPLPLREGVGGRGAYRFDPSPNPLPQGEGEYPSLRPHRFHSTRVGRPGRWSTRDNRVCVAVAGRRPTDAAIRADLNVFRLDRRPVGTWQCLTRGQPASKLLTRRSRRTTEQHGECVALDQPTRTRTLRGAPWCCVISALYQPPQPLTHGRHPPRHADHRVKPGGRLRPRHPRLFPAANCIVVDGGPAPAMAGEVAPTSQWFGRLVLEHFPTKLTRQRVFLQAADFRVDSGWSENALNALLNSVPAQAPPWGCPTRKPESERRGRR